MSTERLSQASSEPPPLLCAEALCVRYPDEVWGLDGLDLTLPGTGITCLLGANGAGKTTLIEAAAGILAPTSGRLRVRGDRPGSPTNRTSLGVMLQESGLPGGARPRVFLEHLARLYPRPRDVRELMASVEVDPDLRTPIRRLSGGQAKRIAWAAAMVGSPTAMLLDEPTAGMDPPGRDRLYEVLRDQRSRGVAMVVSTHLTEDVEHLADLIVVIRDGRSALIGTPEQLRPRNTLIVRSTRELEIATLLAAMPRGTSCSRESPDTYRIDVPSGLDAAVITTVSSWCTEHGVPADVTIADLRSVLKEALRGSERS